MRFYALFAVLLLGNPMMACTPTAQLVAPSEPININLNVKTEHETYIKVDKALGGIINENNGLFQGSGPMTTRGKPGIVLLALGINPSTTTMDLGRAMSALGGAKVQGLVDEQAGGYLGMVSNSSQTADIAAQINAARRAEYQKVANSSGASLADVEAVAGGKATEKIPAGQHVQVGGKWVKKQCEGSASALGRCPGHRDRAVSAEFSLL